jgi:hypothetical protein
MRSLTALLTLAGALVLFSPAAPCQAPAGESGWISFEGTWSASGERQLLPMGKDAKASIFRLTGSIVLTSGEGLSRGFRGEAIGFFDGRSVMTGSSVWTDERGDQVFSDISGEQVGTGRHIQGKVTGGTGRYAGVTGDYSFEWQYVVTSEDGTVAGRAVGLKGRVRRGQP